jgi:hypothetical protein
MLKENVKKFLRFTPIAVKWLSFLLRIRRSCVRISGQKLTDFSVFYSLSIEILTQCPEAGHE